jgi:hypothetical protein
MAFCGICGRNHDPNTPCAVANRPAGRDSIRGIIGGRKLAKRVDWILAIVALAMLACAFFMASR